MLYLQRSLAIFLEVNSFICYIYSIKLKVRLLMQFPICQVHIENIKHTNPTSDYCTWTSIGSGALYHENSRYLSTIFMFIYISAGYFIFTINTKIFIEIRLLCNILYTSNNKWVWTLDLKGSQLDAFSP